MKVNTYLGLMVLVPIVMITVGVVTAQGASSYIGMLHITICTWYILNNGDKK